MLSAIREIGKWQRNKSSNDNISTQIIDTFNTTPLIDCIKKIKNPESFRFDINSSYPTAIKTMNYDYSIYEITDTFVLYIDGVWKLNKENI